MLHYLLKSITGIKKSVSLNNKGIVLPVTLSYALIFVLTTTGLVTYAGTTAHQVKRAEGHLRSFYYAEAATEKTLAQIKLFLADNGRIPTAAELSGMEDDLISIDSHYSFLDESSNSTLGVSYDGGGWQTEQLTAGDYAGLNGSVQTINVSVAAHSTQGSAPATVNVTQSVQVQLIPVFQFGVFYDRDLEILPGPTMNFLGPVHSNADIYMGTHNSLNFDSTITAYGDIYQGRKDSSSSMAGDIMIKDANGDDQNMKLPDSSWLDSTHPDWAEDSQTRWSGNVKSSTHNTSSLNLPLPTAAQNRTLIVRRDPSDTQEIIEQKMDYQAHLRIIDGVTQDQNGVPVDLRYCTDSSSISDNGTVNDESDDFCADLSAPLNPISTNSFYNHREGKTIVSKDIDVALLNNSPAFQVIAAGAGSEGTIIYHSDYTHQSISTHQDAIRLTNGAQVYTNGVTVVSENPLYIKGDYNTVAKKPAGVITDAFNILSNGWNDSNSSSTDLNNRVASNTTVNTAVITGNTETTTGNYNGGFENIHRFLESWSGKTLTYSGSVVVLYESAIATGNWAYGDPYYKAPNRNWGFDTDLSDPDYNVPGFPSVYNVVKSGWQVD